MAYQETADIKKQITIIVTFIAILSAMAASVGIFSGGGPGPTSINSIRGKQVDLYGKGVYYHMSAQVAPQGIAQDVVTLFIAIPLLLISLILYRKDPCQGKYFLPEH